MRINTHPAWRSMRSSLAFTLALVLLALLLAVTPGVLASRAIDPSGGLTGTGSSTALSGDRAPEAPTGPAVGTLSAAGTVSPLLQDPANCSQGTDVLVVHPTTGDMHNTLLQDYNTLGQAGGGTLKLSAGTFMINESLDFQKYSNVSIQGSGIGATILTLPPFPIGNFTADNGTPVGLFNTSIGGPLNGVSANLIQVLGAAPINNFALCDLTLNAQANSALEDWSGSLIMDSSGGSHHVYSDISEAGFFGPSTTPNGLHLESSPNGHDPGVGYVIDDLYASNNTMPFENYSNFKGGPNFLNVGAVVNCTLDHVIGTGLAAFEVAPPSGCVMENWNVTGHILIDPSNGGSWGGSLFQNVTVDSSGTAAPNALGISVANGTSPGSSNFTGLRWVGDHFFGSVLNGVNLVDVQNSTFEGGLNSTPATFEGNTVYWGAVLSPQGLALPIRVDGAPAGGTCSVFTNNTFYFPTGTGNRDPFLLTAPQNTWQNDTVEIGGSTNGYVLSAPNVAVAPYSLFSGITYDSLGHGAPPQLVLFDIVGSPGFSDLGAVVGPLTRVYNDLPQYVPSTPTGLVGVAKGYTQVALSWNASAGTVTNYTVLVGESPTLLVTVDPVGRSTSYVAYDLSPGVGYYFSVEAWNTSSFHSPAASPIEVATPPLPVYVPGVPTGLAVGSRTPTSIGLAWDPSTGPVTNYTVFAGANLSALAPEFSVGTSTSFLVTGLVPSTTYYFAVEAWNLSWTVGPSAPVNGTTASLPPPPAPPSQVTSSSDPMTAYDLAVVVGTLGAVAGAIVLPLLLVSFTRTRARSRRSRAQHSRRASGQRS